MRSQKQASKVGGGLIKEGSPGIASHTSSRDQTSVSPCPSGSNQDGLGKLGSIRKHMAVPAWEERSTNSKHQSREDSNIKNTQIFTLGGDRFDRSWLR